MQKTRKQILGIAGLLAVGVMTAIACAMPAPNAAAIGDSKVDVNVTIREGAPRVKLESPLNDSSSIDPNTSVVYSFEDVVRVETHLIYTDDSGAVIDTIIDSYTPTEKYGTRSFSTDLSSLGYREYRIKTVGYSNAGTTREDTVSFNYRAIKADFDRGVTANNDPILSVESNADVEKVQVQVYDKDGKPLFVKDGKEVPILLNRSSIDPTTGKMTVALPFGEYGAADGEYTAVIVAYNKADDIISMVTLPVKYSRNGTGTGDGSTNPGQVTPETPNTGSTLFGGLTRIDYIITALVAFVVAAGFAVFLVSRRNQRQN